MGLRMLGFNDRRLHLSIATLRVRGAGRTDKGVHASGQVVAFDIPAHYLLEGYGSAIAGKLCKEGDEQLSIHALPLLRQAYQSVMSSAFLGFTTAKVTEGKIDPKERQILPAQERDEEKKRKHEAAQNFHTTEDQWEIRRAISTRLPGDIGIRSVWIWNGSHPFEARDGIKSKTYTYNLRFRCLGYIIPNNNETDIANTQIQKDGESISTMERKQIIHPICNGGPHMLRRINDQNTVWLCQWPLNPTILQSACRAFEGLHDFRNFVHKEERRKMKEMIEKEGENLEGNNNPHEIDLMEFTPRFQLEGQDGWSTDVPSVSSMSIPPIINVNFRLKAKGFHRSMVRMLVGFVVDVARGFRSLADIPKLLLKDDGQGKKIEATAHAAAQSVKDVPGNISKATHMVNTAPACGLFLAKVQYDHDNFHES